MIPPDVVILTRAEFEETKTAAFQRGVERGKFEAIATPAESAEPLLRIAIDQMSEGGKVSYWVTLYRRGKPKPWDGMSLCKCPTLNDADIEAKTWRRWLAPVLAGSEG